MPEEPIYIAAFTDSSEQLSEILHFRRDDAKEYEYTHPGEKIVPASEWEEWQKFRAEKAEKEAAENAKRNQKLNLLSILRILQ
jgi:hypothetical protein